MNAIVQADQSYGLPVSGMAPGLAIMFNDALYDRCKQIAKIMAAAQGFTPRHLLGQQEACFAVVTRAITWKLDPLAVAQSTYQTPGGQVGYEGKLVQAILENSGHLIGPVTYEHFGDWSKVQGKWKKAKSMKGNEYAVQGWTDDDEIGLGVIVRAQVRGEDKPREFVMLLRECYPRNSTLWALRPSQQICYTAGRAFGNIAAPGLLMGVPFRGDEDESMMVDVTPASARPERRDFKSAPIGEETATTIAGAPPLNADEPIDAQEEGTGDVMPESQGEDSPIPEFGHADAHFLGVDGRNAGKSIYSVPADLDQQYHEAWKDGWRERDAEIAESQKAKK
jgi:hypothetical protein